MTASFSRYIYLQDMLEVNPKLVLKFGEKIHQFWYFDVISACRIWVIYFLDFAILAHSDILNRNK